MGIGLILSTIAQVALPLIFSSEKIFGAKTGPVKHKVVSGQLQIAMDQMLAAGKIKPTEVDIPQFLNFLVGVLNELGVLNGGGQVSKVLISGTNLKIEYPTESSGQ